MSRPHRAGFVALLGRPNAGKSTLMNALLGEKLAIVTPKPQTTRDRIRGIRPVEGGQIVFVDTPGVHRGGKLLNRHLTDVAFGSLGDVDLVICVVDAARALHDEDRLVLDAIKAAGKPSLCALNKVDRVQKPKLLPRIAELAGFGCFSAVIPVSAATGEGLDALLAECVGHLPEGPPLFDPEELTDRPVRFLVAELVREQVFLQTQDELPYSTAVEVTSYKTRADRPLVEIDATIHVERPSQKGIVLGKGGERIRSIGEAARPAIEALVGAQVFLRTHVRVEPTWTRDEKRLRKLGYK